MIFYRICEGFLGDTYEFADIMHETDFNEEDFNTMYYQALGEAKKKDGFVDFDQVADIMCDKFGFKRIVVKFSRNIDFDRESKLREPQTMEGSFEAIGSLLEMFSRKIESDAKEYAKSLDAELLEEIDNHNTKDRK